MLYHVIGCLLLYAVLQRLLEPGAGPLMGTLVFALHPVHTETVAWLTGRSDVAVLAWLLLAFLLYLRERRALENYRRSWRTLPDPDRNAEALEAIRRLGG